MTQMVLQSLLETLYMVSVSTLFGFCIGTPLALYLFLIQPKGLHPRRVTYALLSFFINAMRSIPYIIFMVLIIPLTRFLAGTSIGTMAATVPLSLASILLFTRFAEETFRQISPGLVEAGRVMGATNLQILFKIVLKESLPTLIASLTQLLIMLIGFSAMAGAVGGGGLGDLAIRYGYQRYNLELLFSIVVILIVLVQGVQYIGDRLVLYLRK